MNVVLRGALAIGVLTSLAVGCSSTSCPDDFGAAPLPVIVVNDKASGQNLCDAFVTVSDGTTTFRSTLAQSADPDSGAPLCQYTPQITAPYSAELYVATAIAQSYQRAKASFRIITGPCGAVAVPGLITLDLPPN